MRMEKVNEEERLVKIAVKVQHQMDGRGNLFMDAPAHQNFEDIESIAKDRAKWRRHVDAKFGSKPKRKCTQRNKRLTVGTRNPALMMLGRWVGTGIDAVWIIGPGPQPTRTTTATTTITNVTSAPKCTARTIQTQLPLAWQPTLRAKCNKLTKTKIRKPKNNEQTKKRKSKSTGLTEAQRAAYAHAHYIIHHGTKADAARFLTYPTNVTNTPTTALDEIRLMAAMQVPTWEQAAAVVFSSSAAAMTAITVMRTLQHTVGPD